MARPRRIHLASRCYIRGWATGGKVAVQSGDLSFAPELRNVDSVAWRPAWWGNNAKLSAAAEGTLQQVDESCWG